MKEGSLFVLFVPMRSTKPGCFRSCSWSLWKAFKEEVCISLVSSHLDLWCKNSWILNDFSLKIKLNCSWKFRRNWNVPLVLSKRSWWAGFLWNLFGKIWIQNVEDIDLKVISAAENSNQNFKNQVFKGKISWGCDNAWANSSGHTGLS